MHKQDYNNYINTITYYFNVLLTHDKPFMLECTMLGNKLYIYALTISLGLKYKQHITCQRISKNSMKYNKQYILYTMYIHCTNE